MEYETKFGDGAFEEDFGRMPEFFQNGRQIRLWNKNLADAELAIEQGERMM